MLNLLALLRYQEITFNDANRIFDDVIEKIHTGDMPEHWAEFLGFSRDEFAAYLRGATLEALVKLRYEGWPDACSRCGHPVDYRLYNWWFARSADHAPRLHHIECPGTEAA
jgi:hypothetical protein